jgi:hypothetical protein
MRFSRREGVLGSHSLSREQAVHPSVERTRGEVMEKRRPGNPFMTLDRIEDENTSVLSRVYDTFSPSGDAVYRDLATVPMETARRAAHAEPTHRNRRRP